MLLKNVAQNQKQYHVYKQKKRRKHLSENSMFTINSSIESANTSGKQFVRKLLIKYSNYATLSEKILFGSQRLREMKY